jgi:hypothetical protein
VITTIDRQLAAFHIVQLATLAALLWKVAFFIEAVKVYSQLPLRQRLFPAFFESATTFAVSYAVVLLAIAYLVVTRSRLLRCGVAVLALLGLSVLCIHQGSYNDASFTTAWWTMLWSVWFASRMDSNDDSLLLRGGKLSRAIVSMMLLGGAVGKWTGEYWSGQVLYELYFHDRDFWLFNLLRANYEPETLREIATWYSRKVILVETVLGLTLWAMTPRLAAVVGITVFASIAMFSNFYLFSVVLSLIGLAAAGLFVPTAKTNRCASVLAVHSPVVGAEG